MNKIIIVALLLFGGLTGEKDATIIAAKQSDKQGVSFVHPVHVSFTTIDYLENEKKFRILFKIFVDDFDLILKAKYGNDLQLSKGKWEKRYPKVINTYLLEHFKFIVDGKDRTKTNLKYIRYKIEEKAIWLYYDFNTKYQSKEFVIYNSLMTDLYPDQKNLLILTIKNDQKALIYNRKKMKQDIRF